MRYENSIIRVREFCLYFNICLVSAFVMKKGQILLPNIEKKNYYDNYRYHYNYRNHQHHHYNYYHQHYYYTIIIIIIIVTMTIFTISFKHYKHNTHSLRGLTIFSRRTFCTLGYSGKSAALLGRLKMKSKTVVK